MKKLPSPAELLTKCPNLIAAADKVAMAKVHFAHQREKLDRLVYGALLKERVFNVKDEYRREGQDPRITDPRRTYLMNDADFDMYHAECQRRIIDMGYKVPKDHCPALIAERELMDAQSELIEVLTPITGVKGVKEIVQGADGLENLNRFVDLALKLANSLAKLR